MGYYIRSQAFAVVDGITYNINNYMTTEDFAIDGKWMYSVNAGGDRVAMAPSGETGSQLTLIDSVKFPASFINAHQGKYIKLFLFVEGSATNNFDSII